MALYQCKYAQWKQQEGVCGLCSEPMDPKHAVWIATKWLDGTGLAKWAVGHDLVFNEGSEEFDATPRSPAEITEEYREGLNGHYLWHKRCRVKFRRVGAGIPTRGPAHVREYDKLVAQGIPTHEAVTRADEVLRDQSRARMEEARSHKRSKRRTWTHEERSENRAAKQREAGPARSNTTANRRCKSPKRGVAPKPNTPSEFNRLRLNTPAVPYQPDPASENLRAAQQEAESREPTALEHACYEGTPEERLGRLMDENDGLLNRLASAFEG
jgi:hypothetical protein